MLPFHYPAGMGFDSSVQLPFTPPFPWSSLLAYLRLRAIPGVETVDATHYRRTVCIEEATGWIAVSLHSNAQALNLEISPSLRAVNDVIVARVEPLFDLGALPDAVAALLCEDPLLGATVRRLPGLRVAGAFDGFELAYRTVLGQQVSVKAATTIAGRLARAFGAPIATPYAGLDRLSPGAQVLGNLSVDAIAALGVIGKRAQCIKDLARAVEERRVVLAGAANVEEQIDRLMSVPGIGEWTAHYIAMRALHWPDAFPDGDLVLMKAAQMNRRQLKQRAANWRPWRAYAAHYLWQSLGVNP